MELSQLSIAARDKKDEILEGLNDAQKDVVRNYEGFSIVSSGPGSGKERV